MTLDEKIAEAETALHQLSIGKRVAKITRDGKSVDFTPANRADLERYLGGLKREKTPHRRRPMRVF